MGNPNGIVAWSSFSPLNLPLEWHAPFSDKPKYHPTICGHMRVHRSTCSCCPGNKLQGVAPASKICTAICNTLCWIFTLHHPAFLGIWFTWSAVLCGKVPTSTSHNLTNGMSRMSRMSQPSGLWFLFMGIQPTQKGDNRTIFGIWDGEWGKS